ncbi:MAG: hypothetical protein ACYTFI_18770 [Planctomycetota bacterium]
MRSISARADFTSEYSARSDLSSAASTPGPTASSPRMESRSLCLTKAKTFLSTRSRGAFGPDLDGRSSKSWMSPIPVSGLGSDRSSGMLRKTHCISWYTDCK